MRRAGARLCAAAAARPRATAASRRLASAVAAAGCAFALAACRPAGPAPAPVRAAPDDEPVVRVGVRVDTTEVVIGSGGPYEIAPVGGADVVRGEAGTSWRFTADERGRLEATGPDGRRIGPFETPVRVSTRDDGAVWIGERPYRGAALVRAAAPDRVTAVNALALEDYLLGVVPREIPEADLEAVKAQAVAARTYAVGHLGNREQLGFDFFATVADQVYGGRADERADATRAVRETQGEILLHSGAPILAFYHSTCGGSTAAVDEVWNRPPQPYLRPVSDRVPGSDDAYYCQTSNRFRWTERWSGAALAAILSETLPAHTGEAVATVERVTALEVLGWTTSGRVRALRVGVDGREFTVFGDSIRRVLRPEPDRILNSILFELDVERDEAGAIRSVTAHGGGWGHGIGMCQIGAMGRARAGQDYREILTTYYRGADVAEVY